MFSRLVHGRLVSQSISAVSLNMLLCPRQLRDASGSHQAALTQLQRERDSARSEIDAVKGQIAQRDAALQVSLTRSDMAG